MTDSDADPRVTLEKDAATHVARITIDNPTRRNAYDPPMRRRMAEFLDDLAADDDVKVVILRGTGGVFSTGADMNNAYNWYRPGEEGRRPSQRRRLGVDRESFGFYHDYLGFPKVTIAQVETYALGGGFELALMSDLTVVARDAQLGMPGARLLGPALGNLHLFFYRLGPVLARRLLLTGDTITAAEVEHLGLFTDVCDAGQVAERTEAWATKVAKMPADVPALEQRRVAGEVDDGRHEDREVGVGDRSHERGIRHGSGLSRARRPRSRRRGGGRPRWCRASPGPSRS